jgi:hypothetical protein
VVAGEDAQAAGVDWQRLVQPELGREVRHPHGRLLRVGLVEPALFVEVVLELFVDAVHVRDVTFVGRGGCELRLVDHAQHLHRVVVDLLPELSVEPAEQLDGVGVPDPPEVVGHHQQRIERRRDVGEHLEGPDRGCERTH